MMIKAFNINEKNYYIGLSQFKINLDFKFEQFFNIFEKIQHKYNKLVLQFFNDRYVLNSEHIFNACYYLEKVFLNNQNISNKKNIEFLLYLAANRQIKIALEDFGINSEIFKKGFINLCVISSESSFQSLNLEFERIFNINRIDFVLDNYSQKKYEEIKLYFDFPDKQIETVLASYHKKIDLKEIQDSDLPNLYLALNDLICEKMALLSLEKVSLD
ncbi:MAG: KEOPS complex subunit Cgi121 [Promethearchaeota archaeon]